MGGGGGVSDASSWGGGVRVEVVCMQGLGVVRMGGVVLAVVVLLLLRGELGVVLVSVCVLRVGVDHFVDHLAAIRLLRVECKHRLIEGVDGPALVDVEEGREVVERGCRGCCGGRAGRCASSGSSGSRPLARGGGPGRGQTCYRVDGEGQREEEVCPRGGVGGLRRLGGEPGGVRAERDGGWGGDAVVGGEEVVAHDSGGFSGGEGGTIYSMYTAEATRAALLYSICVLCLGGSRCGCENANRRTNAQVK